MFRTPSQPNVCWLTKSSFRVQHVVADDGFFLTPQVEIGGGLWDEYQLLEVLGKGAFGTVRKIHSRRTGQYAAVKVFVKSRFVDTAEKFMQSYQREIEIISHLHHVCPCMLAQYAFQPNRDS
jgi:serine/threonine protein kinase